MQRGFRDIENSGRCRIHNEIKQSYEMESYLKYHTRRTIRINFPRFRLSSHSFLTEIGRWMKPKVELLNRLSTLCSENYI